MRFVGKLSFVLVFLFVFRVVALNVFPPVALRLRLFRRLGSAPLLFLLFGFFSPLAALFALQLFLEASPLFVSSGCPNCRLADTRLARAKGRSPGLVPLFG